MPEKIYFTLIILVILVFNGCNRMMSDPVIDNSIEPVQSHDSGMTFAGTYSFDGNDGSHETGSLYVDNEGHLRLLPEGRSSSFSNWWFDVDFTYLNPRYYDPAGLPIYFPGDDMKYSVYLDYKRGLPLNMYPILYCKMQIDQMYYPQGGHPAGESIRIFDPLSIAPYGEINVTGNYPIPSGIIPSEYFSFITIYLEVLRGTYEFRLASGIGGFWGIRN